MSDNIDKQNQGIFEAYEDIIARILVDNVKHLGGLPFILEIPEKRRGSNEIQDRAYVATFVGIRDTLTEKYDVLVEQRY